MAKVKYDVTPIPQKEQREPKISESQRSYLKDLLGKKDMAGVDGEKLDSVWKSLRISEDPEEYGMSKGQASRLIDWCLTRPDKPREDPRVEHAHISELPDVPAGRYAVDNEDGVLRFYSVARPNEGKWKGFTFLNVWASDEQHPVKGAAAVRTILQKIIDAGIKESAEQFGQEIGCCAVCGRVLTDSDSRSIGIGPVCRERTDWY